MRRILLLTVLSLVGLVARGQVLFDSYSFDFGQISEVDGVVEHTFSYKNEGRAPVVILSVSVSCGCTTPSYSVKPLAAGDSAEFTVRFDPTDRPGRFEKSIYIRTNLEEPVKLLITGDVVGRPRTMQDDFPYLIASGVRLAALSLNVERAAVGVPLLRTIGLANSSLAVGAMVAIDTLSLPRWLKARVVKPFLGAGERTQIEFTMQSTEFGLHHADVVFMINGERQAEKIWVEAIFTRDFSRLTPIDRRDTGRIELSSYFYHFSNRKRGEKLERSFEIKNTGKADLVVDRLESSSGDIRFSIDRNVLKVGQSATLKIEASPTVEGIFSETVRIISSDSQNPVREVRIMANII